MWTTQDKLAAGSLAVALTSCVLAAIVVPEIRAMVGLPVEQVRVQPPPVDTSSMQAGGTTVVTPLVKPADPPRPRPIPHPTDGATVPAPAARYLAVRSTSASSALPPSRVAAYGPEMVVDGNGATPWVENGLGYGIGEWIELDLGVRLTVTHLRFLNGYDKGSRFRENARIRSLTVTFSNGESRTLALEDTRAEQLIAVGNVLTSRLRLTINSVYEGSRWEDTALGDVAVIGF